MSKTAPNCSNSDGPTEDCLYFDPKQTSLLVSFSTPLENSEQGLVNAF